MTEDADLEQQTDESGEVEEMMSPNSFAIKEFGEDYYLKTLMETCPQTITIAYEKKYPELTPMTFDFIPEPQELSHGVKISDEIKYEDIDS